LGDKGDKGGGSPKEGRFSARLIYPDPGTSNRLRNPGENARGSSKKEKLPFLKGVCDCTFFRTEHRRKLTGRMNDLHLQRGHCKHAWCLEENTGKRVREKGNRKSFLSRSTEILQGEKASRLTIRGTTAPREKD